MLPASPIIRESEAIMNRHSPTAYFNVFSVREFEAATGQKAKSWTKVGAAFPHKDAPGFNIELNLLPLDGRLVALPPSEEEDSGS
jgi:hypothetical protein